MNAHTQRNYARSDARVDDFGLSFAALRSMPFPPIKWLVQGILPEGATILAGKPKLGKSWLALDIAIQVAATLDGYVLGDRVCSSGDVLYLALEDNQRRLQDRGRKVIGLGSEWPERLTVATEWPRADQGGIEKIERWARSVQNPVLVIVDVLTAFRAHPGPRENKSTYATDYDAVAALRSVAGKFGLSVLIVHHTRKGESDDPVDAVSGTLGLTGAADTILVLNRRADAGVTLYGRGRDIAELDLALIFNAESCRWIVRGETADVCRSDERSKILMVLFDTHKPLTPSDIALAAGMPRNNVDQLLYKMARAGDVQKSGRGRYIHHMRIDLTDLSESPPDKNDKKVRSEDGEGADGEMSE